MLDFKACGVDFMPTEGNFGSNIKEKVLPLSTPNILKSDTCEQWAKHVVRKLHGMCVEVQWF